MLLQHFFSLSRKLRIRNAIKRSTRICRVEYEKDTNHHLIFDRLEWTKWSRCTWWKKIPNFRQPRMKNSATETCWPLKKQHDFCLFYFSLPKKQNKQVQVNPCQRNVVTQTHTHTQTRVGVWVKSSNMWDISTLLVITGTCLICLFPCCTCFYKYSITTT